MQCPTDGTTLAMATREGIEIDYCPTCRGVWLDRGELDKIIERSAAMVAPVREASSRDARDVRDARDRRDAPVVPYDEPQAPRTHRRDDDDDDRRYDQHGRRKRRSFLDDLFDFD